MMVKLGKQEVGPGRPVYVVAEAGINHNGDVGLARALIRAAADAGCQAVKFQKRTVDVVYSEEELARPRRSPFGSTNGELKRALEFGRTEYEALAECAAAHDIALFASCWDEASVDFMEQFNPPMYKIASASLTDIALLRRHRATGKPVIASTGMSDAKQVERAVAALGSANLVLLHTVSAYPAQPEDLNLHVMAQLARDYRVPVGYSGHEAGLAPTLAAVALGACVVERHLTLDRNAWGSDQGVSLEPDEMARLVREIREVEAALGTAHKRVLESEFPARAKLRRVS